MQLIGLSNVHSEEIDAESLIIDLLVIVQEKARLDTADTAKAQVDQTLNDLFGAVSFGEPREEGGVVACGIRE